jgi:hypothetical protein
MRTRSRGAVVQGAAATVSLTLLASLLTTGLLTGAPARADDPARTRALDLLGRVVDAFMPHPRPEGRKLPRRDVGLMLRDLRVARADLDPAARLLADQYLARPSAGEDCKPGGILNPESVLRTTHFCIHYKTGGGGAATLQQAQLTGATLENVWTVLVGRRGFRPPVPDGDGVFDVTLKQLGDQGIYGYCTTDTATAQSSSYCVLDNDFSAAEYGAPPVNSLRVTAAHEFFHAIQFAYDSFEQSWVLEGGAVWAEDEVYPTVNDYLQYLAFSPVRIPGTPIDSNGSFERYGIGIFWKFLAEYLRDPAVIRQFWRLADSPAERDGIGAVVATLAARKKAFGPTFARFAAWNTLPAGSYADRRLFPSPRWARVLQLRLKRLGTGPLRASLDHLSSAAYLIQPARTLRPTSRLRVTVDGPVRATQPQALVQVRFRDGRVGYYAVPLDAAGDGVRAVPFDPRKVRSAVVTLSNASVNRADDQPFTLRARVVR